MKNSWLFLVMFGCIFLNNLAHTAAIEVDIPFIEDIHVPLGFDSNDQDVEISVTLALPDTCYRRPHGIAKIDGNQIYIDMKATKLIDKGLMCIKAMVPSLVTVSLGQMPEGLYSIKVNTGKESEKESVLVVAKPHAQSIDNFTYANVTSAEVDQSKKTLLLKGAHPSSCIDMNNDEIVVMPNLNGNTFAILPIVRQVKPICDRMMKPFTYEVKLPAVMQDQSVVYHIRKIGGDALNVRG